MVDRSMAQNQDALSMTERELAKRIRDRIGVIPITASVQTRHVISAELLNRIADTAAHEAVVQLTDGETGKGK